MALPLPGRVARALAALRPAPGAGVRPVEAQDLHVTLLFLGNARIAPLRPILDAHAAPRFTLRLGAPGCFELRGGRRILWIGVEPAPALSRLQSELVRALEPLGFEPESRPYVPHITLARLGADAPAAVRTRFLEQSVPDAAREFVCEAFALYLTRPQAKTPRYRIVQAYALAP